ncbi:MAG: DUF4410 domain-containing protein [Chthoniobacterales bacterium]|nr:DUF4410 domain-containing protein [Chthoniobacterales bacterium]
MKHSLYLVYLRYVIISILAFSIISCASVSVNHIVPSNSHPAHLPERIYIESFEAPPLHFQVNRKGKDLMKLIENERTQLANDLLLRLNKRIAPTFLLLPGEAPPTGNFWLLKGSFEVVQEGSRILRAGIGLGLGKTKMETDVQLIDLSGNSKQSLLLKMKTTGGSGMAPGAAAAFTPIGPFVLSNALINAGGSVGGALGSGVSMDRRRTAREIVATISAYCVEKGLIPKKRGLHPKLLGKIPHFIIMN